MNYETPLEVFLPPSTDAFGLENVDLLITRNWDGLNSGVFGLRVSPWSVTFLSAVLAYPIYESGRLKTDKFRDQSAFQYLLEDKKSPFADTPMAGRDHWVVVPMRWFNSLPVNNAFYKNGTWLFGHKMLEAEFDKGTTEVLDDGQGGKVKPWKVMQGDLVVHFAGTSYVRDSWMGPWVDRAEAALPEWNNATTQIALKKEVDEFWADKNTKMTVERKQSAEDEEKKAKERAEREKQEKEKKKQEEQDKKKKEEEDKKKLEMKKSEEDRLEKERKAKAKEEEKTRLMEEEAKKQAADTKA